MSVSPVSREVRPPPQGQYQQLVAKDKAWPLPDERPIATPNSLKPPSQVWTTPPSTKNQKMVLPLGQLPAHSITSLLLPPHGPLGGPEIPPPSPGIEGRNTHRFFFTPILGSVPRVPQDQLFSLRRVIYPAFTPCPNQHSPSVGSRHKQQPAAAPHTQWTAAARRRDREIYAERLNTWHRAWSVWGPSMPSRSWPVEYLRQDAGPQPRLLESLRPENMPPFPDTVTGEGCADRPQVPWDLQPGWSRRRIELGGSEGRDWRSGDGVPSWGIFCCRIQSLSWDEELLLDEDTSATKSALISTFWPLCYACVFPPMCVRYYRNHIREDKSGSVRIHFDKCLDDFRMISSGSDLRQCANGIRALDIPVDAFLDLNETSALSLLRHTLAVATPATGPATSGAIGGTYLAERGSASFTHCIPSGPVWVAGTNERNSRGWAYPINVQAVEKLAKVEGEGMIFVEYDTLMRELSRAYRLPTGKWVCSVIWPAARCNGVLRS